MCVKFSQLQCREVICIADGRRLGFVEDAELSLPEGRVTALLVPVPGKLPLAPFSRQCYRIPMEKVCRIGPDIVLVDVCAGDCATTGKKRLPF